MRKSLLLILALLPCLAGCPVLQSQDTPVSERKVLDPVTGRRYWIYVPSTYTPDRGWPVVITLHGTFGFDSPNAQIREWKALAEKRGFIVVAPPLKSVQGVLPVIKPLWYKDLATDEDTILSCLRHVRQRYRIARDATTGKELVMLTGFSAGGFPMYYTGLRNPHKFSLLVARACNSNSGLFKKIVVTDAVRRLPVVIFHGRRDPIIAAQSSTALRWFRRNGCTRTAQYKTDGGHRRRPGVAYQFWAPQLDRFAKRRTTSIISTGWAEP